MKPGQILDEKRHPIIRGLPAVIVLVIERGLDFAGWTNLTIAICLWVIAGIFILILFWPWLKWPFSLLGLIGLRSPLYIRSRQATTTDSQEKVGLFNEHGPQSGSTEVLYQGNRPALAGNIRTLIQPFEIHTQKELRNYIESKIDCWMPVSGVISDISEDLDMLGKVTGIMVSLKSVLGQPAIYCHFDEKSRDALKPLAKHDTISLIGRIKELKRSWITLRDCERLKDDGTEYVSSLR